MKASAVARALSGANGNACRNRLHVGGCWRFDVSQQRCHGASHIRVGSPAEGGRYQNRSPELLARRQRLCVAPRLNLISERTLNTQLGSTVRQRVRRNGWSRACGKDSEARPLRSTRGSSLSNPRFASPALSTSARTIQWLPSCVTDLFFVAAFLVRVCDALRRLRSRFRASQP